MQDLVSQTATFVLAGGRGSRLDPLTRDRSKPAVPFGDRRIIDFSLANCLRSNLKHPFVITQYQASHLTRHVRRWWLEHSASIADVTAAPVCVPAPRIDYRGTADALFQNLRLIERDTQNVLVLSADHIYNMDYRALLRFHSERRADVTLAAIVYPKEASREFGILEVDRSDRIGGFQEKPAAPRELPGQPGNVLANMGMYVFRKDVLLEALLRDAANPDSVHDIGRNIFPDLASRRNMAAFRFEDPKTGTPGYWKDVGTIDSYYEANMEWLRTLPAGHRLYRSGSVIAEGAWVHPRAQVVDSIVMRGVSIGAGARIQRAILDENVRVLPGAQIGNGNTREIVVVPANSVVGAGRTESQPESQPGSWMYGALTQGA